ncbi:hypothetical protein EVAR_49238_1 [Eumeta japonica]|uniref:Uncharacterized protein n=1 Tax=Eumeta variegata TaxID=151549 RepID=A0A4C1YC15_EUMVA|nr:hypothetical protein EVAR_49238_1 [Eumeta japonica]
MCRRHTVYGQTASLSGLELNGDVPTSECIFSLSSCDSGAVHSSITSLMMRGVGDGRHLSRRRGRRARPPAEPPNTALPIDAADTA